jgi:hypothetical protein
MHYNNIITHTRAALGLHDEHIVIYVYYYVYYSYIILYSPRKRENKKRGNLKPLLVYECSNNELFRGAHYTYEGGGAYCDNTHNTYVL